MLLNRWCGRFLILELSVKIPPGRFTVSVTQARPFNEGEVKASLQCKLPGAFHEFRFLALGHIHFAGLHDGCMDEPAQGH